MHGDNDVKYAILDTNHTPTLILLLVPSKNKEKKRKSKLPVYYTTFAGNAIALSVCNKPLNL